MTNEEKSPESNIFPRLMLLTFHVLVLKKVHLNSLCLLFNKEKETRKIEHYNIEINNSKRRKKKDYRKRQKKKWIQCKDWTWKRT